jgi:hypothetical protein
MTLTVGRWPRIAKAFVLIWLGIFLQAVSLTSTFAKDITPSQSEPLRPGLTAYAFDIAADGEASAFQIIFIESGKTEYPPHVIGGVGHIGSVPYSFPATLAELTFNDAGQRLSM